MNKGYALICAAWLVFAIIQISLPPHPQSLSWFGIDLGMAMMFGALAIKDRRA